MEITLEHIHKDLVLEIEGDENTLFCISDIEVMQYGEAKIQLVEGRNYEYQFNNQNFRFKESIKNKIVTHSKFGKYKGNLNPNIYVGTHTLEIEDIISKSDYIFSVEVRSIKSEYRADYRYMLESITERCTDLIMQIDSPITQHFETEFNKNPETIYQRFSFVKSLIDSIEFEEAVQKIITSPTTKWDEEIEEKDIRSIRRFNQNNIRQLISKGNRISIHQSHFLNDSYGLNSVPNKIESSRKIESVDTSENRFVKHALEVFLFFCENCNIYFAKFSRAKLESIILCNKISSFLNQPFFKEITRPTSLKLNSPVLQRKSGYREVLNSWLKFDLAAKLIWQGGDNVYDAGKKDIATLYEYWLFFMLLDLMKEVFKIEPKSIQKLIQFDKGRLSLTLKQGTAIALDGIYKSDSRNLNVQFSYNRSFGGGKKYPLGGSYTKTLRPDYTLSIWPEGKSSLEAEETELITHIHFDAKYKIDNFYKLLMSKSDDDKLTDEENEQLLLEEEEEIKSGNFKNQDLLKMHAYKDAIRRTSGAYVLYPGKGKDNPFRGFHELIPGLGAFVIKPNKNDNDRDYLKKFILKVVDNFIDRSSQREYTSVKIYDIHKNKKNDLETLNEQIPEYDLVGNKLIPDETFVLVGYSTNSKRLDWYKNNSKYVFRINGDKGSLELSNEVVNAKYLLIRESGEDKASSIHKIISKGPKVYSKEELRKLNYPFSNNPKDYYLVIEIDNVVDNDFGNASWDYKKLQEYKDKIDSEPNKVIAVGIPFTVSMTNLMKKVVKES